MAKLTRALRAQLAPDARLHGVKRTSKRVYAFTGTQRSDYCIATYMATTRGLALQTAHVFDCYATALQVWRKL